MTGIEEKLSYHFRTLFQDLRVDIESLDIEAPLHKVSCHGESHVSNSNESDSL
jgi:hypothetical protein